METWRDIEGYEGIYQVSDAGNVRSLDRVDAAGHNLKGKPRKLHSDKDGYNIVCLNRDAVRRYHKVHRLVAAAFIPNPHNFPQVNHTEGNKTDNRACKLEWCTNQENIDHAKDNGLLCRGSDVNTAKLSQYDVIDIRWLASLGVRKNVLAREWGVTPANIGHIVSGRSWSHV